MLPLSPYRTSKADSCSHSLNTHTTRLSTRNQSTRRTRLTVSPDFTDGTSTLLTALTNRHIDAALYGLSPPKVTTLYAVKVPGGEQQICRYDDGTGDELKVPIGGTACESLYCA